MTAEFNLGAMLSTPQCSNVGQSRVRKSPIDGIAVYCEE